MTNIKRLLGLAVLALVACAGTAKASDTPTYEIGYSSFGTRGVVCSTGTASQINLTAPVGFKSRVAGYRIQNQDSSKTVWLGGVSVSSSATNNNSTDLSNLGEQLISGANAPWGFGRDYSLSAQVPIYCKAQDSATSGVLLSVIWFGY